jgi:chromosome segregation ATPase
MKLFADEMSQTYKKQESQVQRLDKEIKQFNEDLRLQEMQLSKQEKAQAASLKIVREQEEELRQVKEKLEKETALNKQLDESLHIVQREIIEQKRRQSGTAGLVSGQERST